MYAIIPLCSVIAIYLWMQITKKHNASHSFPICFALNKQDKKKKRQSNSPVFLYDSIQFKALHVRVH